MPITTSHLKNDKRTVTVEYAGESAQVTYFPSQITPNIMADMREANEEGNDYFTVDILCRLVTSWDVLDETGQPLPINHENLANLASPFLSKVLQDCTEDMFGKKRTGRR